MSDDNAVELIRRSDKRFADRGSLDAMRDEIALNFAPRHALWTSTQTLGADFASHLVESTPMIVAEEFVGMIGSMLRPSGRQWFWHRSEEDEINQHQEARDYLDWRSERMMRILFDRVTGAEGALSEADEFYGLFGDAVLSTDVVGAKQDRLRVGHYHSKDVAWEIGAENKADVISRREELSARVIMDRFNRSTDRVHAKIREACDKDDSKPFPLRHEVLPAKVYDSYIRRKPSLARGGWASVWVDCEHKTIIREVYTPTIRYVIPRAGRRYGYPYGVSRATLIALPDARLIQQQALAILEAAEKSVSPPIIAYADTIRGTANLAPHGITWVDRDYDSRTGDPVVPLELGKNFRLGVDSLMRTEAQIARAFKLDRMRFPDTRATKTVEEARFMIDEFVRSAVPMFSPMKSEYSDEFLFEADTLIDLFGGYDDRPMPEVLKNRRLVFQWDNPLTDMLERQKVTKVAEVAQLTQAVAGIETVAAQVPSLKQIKVPDMYRESVMALGGARWLMSEREAAKAAKEGQEANSMREMAAAAPDLAAAMKSGVDAASVAADIPNPAEPGFALMPPS